MRNYVHILAIMRSECYSTTIRSTTRKITAMYDAALAPAGVTIAQLALLRRLSDETPTSVDGIARSAELERSTAARNVRLLEKQGLVTLGVSDTDRRAAAIVLTAHGVAVRAQCEPLWDEAQRTIEDLFGAKRAAALRELCREFDAIHSAAA
jgi:DNA-binding MarR family transcriptional regulator